MRFKNLLKCFSGSELFEYQLDSDACACNDRLTHHDCWIRLNQIHVHNNSDYTSNNCKH